MRCILCNRFTAW